MTIPPVAIITGAGSGIGRACALRLAARGFRLTLIGRTSETLEETLTEIAAQVDEAKEVLILPADLADAEQAQSVVDLTVERWGRLDAIINNAGMAELHDIDQTTIERLHESFAINTFAPALLIARGWRSLLRSADGTLPSGPCVVNVTTMGTRDPFPGFFIYAAAKCAAESFVRSIANEGGDDGLRAYAIAPGAVETKMLRGLFDESTLSSENTLDPDDVAALIESCIMGERPEPNGSVIPIQR